MVLSLLQKRVSVVVTMHEIPICEMSIASYLFSSVDLVIVHSGHVICCCLYIYYFCFICAHFMLVYFVQSIFQEDLHVV